MGLVNSPTPTPMPAAGPEVALSARGHCYEGSVSCLWVPLPRSQLPKAVGIHL